MLEKYFIGAYEVCMMPRCGYPLLSPPKPQGGPPPAKKVHKVALQHTSKQSSAIASLIKGLLPIAVILIAVIYALYF